MAEVRSWRNGFVFIAAIFFIFMATNIYLQGGKTTSSSSHPSPNRAWTAADTAGEARSTGFINITKLGKYMRVFIMLSHYYTR